jgi:hypothetical protein
MNTLAALIEKVVPALGDLKGHLLSLRASIHEAAIRYPDLGPTLEAKVAEIDARIALLDEATTPEGLAALGKVVIEELAALPHAGIRPAFHPGDVTGG